MYRTVRISVCLVALCAVLAGCCGGDRPLLLNERHGRFYFTLVRTPATGTVYAVRCTGTLVSDHTQYWDTHVLTLVSNADEQCRFQIQEIRPNREFIIFEKSHPNTVLGHYVAFGDGETHYTYPLDVSRRGLSLQEQDQRISGLRKLTGNTQLHYGEPPERPQPPVAPYSEPAARSPHG